MLRRIDELRLDERGDVHDVREFARFSAMPDGLSVDEEGGVWVALWDGGVVQRFTADGRLDRTVSVPGGWITNCAFGGPELRTLYITTAGSTSTPTFRSTATRRFAVRRRGRRRRQGLHAVRDAVAPVTVELRHRRARRKTNG